MMYLKSTSIFIFIRIVYYSRIAKDPKEVKLKKNGVNMLVGRLKSQNKEVISRTLYCRLSAA